jgi:hypothetical protein
MANGRGGVGGGAPRLDAAVKATIAAEIQQWIRFGVIPMKKRRKMTKKQ